MIKNQTTKQNFPENNKVDDFYQYLRVNKYLNKLSTLLCELLQEEQALNNYLYRLNKYGHNIQNIKKMLENPDD